MTPEEETVTSRANPLFKRLLALKKRGVAPEGDLCLLEGPKLLDEAMAVYRRQQRDVYDNLDEETRRQIEEDAAKAFGDVLKHKS